MLRTRDCFGSFTSVGTTNAFGVWLKIVVPAAEGWLAK